MNEHKDCIFCKIVEGVIPSSIVYEDDERYKYYDDEYDY